MIWKLREGPKPGGCGAVFPVQVYYAPEPMFSLYHTTPLWLITIASLSGGAFIGPWDSNFVLIYGFPGGSEGKASACNAGALGSIPGSGRSPGEGNGNSLQCSCLKNPMDGGAWTATVHGVTQSQTWLSDFTFTCLNKNSFPLNGIKNQPLILFIYVAAC